MDVRMDYALITSRLRLVPLTAQQLALCRHGINRLEQQLSISLSQAMFSEPVLGAIDIKLGKMQHASAQLFYWYTYWLVVVTAVDHAPGLIGFKGAPDKNGEVEIGYGIDEQYRNKGYTTEAARALISWAFGNRQQISRNKITRNVADSSRKPQFTKAFDFGELSAVYLEQTGCHAVTAWVESSNPASSRVLQKIGMHPQKSTVQKAKWIISKGEMLFKNTNHG